MIVITSESYENYLYENHINNHAILMRCLKFYYNHKFTRYPTVEPKFYSSLLNLFISLSDTLMESHQDTDLVHLNLSATNGSWEDLAPRPLTEEILKTKILFKISQILLATRFKMQI